MSSRRLAAGAVALGSTAAVAWSLPALAPLAPPLADRLRLDRRLPLSGAVAVTFDDGPHRSGTPAMLETLRDFGATATFFCVGEQVRRTGSLVDEIVAAGHRVAIHGDEHRLVLARTPRALARDLDRAHDTLASRIGSAVLPVHRAPFGIYAPTTRAQLLVRGWRPLLWSRWGHDWRARATPRGITDEVTHSLTAGDVLLLHDADDYSARDSWRATALALPRILERIAQQGLQTALVPPTW